MISRILSVCATAVALAVLVGCGGGLPNADQAAQQGILLFGNGAEPKTIDPQRATGVTENKIISALIEGLVTYHPSDDNLPEPGVAERWEHNADASVWRFFLRADALWSNGDPVTAHDFIYAYRRMLDPGFGGEYAQMLYILQNAEAYKLGTLSDFAQVGVQAIDDHTLEFRLVGPTPFFLSMLKHYSWYPVHPPTIEAHGGMLDLGGDWTLHGNYVGNGPFVLADWKPNQYLRVDKSPTYWDRESVRLNAIIFFPVEDDNSENRMFESGRLHVTGTVPSNQIASYRERRPDILHIDPYLGTYFLRLNVTRPPFDDPRVRLALNLAIDRTALVERVVKGGQQPATAYVPPGFSDYPTHPVLGLDIERARALLAEAGYPGGEGFPSVFFLFNTSEDHRKIAEAVVAMWNQALGIDMQLENKEWKVYLEAQSNLDYDLSRSGWIGDYMDPITFLEMFTTGNGNNDTGWANPQYDAHIAAAFRSSTQDEHLAALRAAEDILLRELPIVPLYWYTRIYLLDPRVKGWNPKLLDNRPYKYLYFE